MSDQNRCPVCGELGHAGCIATIRTEVGAALDEATQILSAELAEALAVRMPCDAGCVEYPEEECSRHGRTPADLWQQLYAVAKQRDALAAELDKDRHEFSPWSHDEQRCSAGWPNPSEYCKCRADEPLHRTSRVVLAELAAEAGR